MTQYHSSHNRQSSVTKIRLLNEGDYDVDSWIKYIQLLHYRTMDLTLDRVTSVIEKICPNGVPFVVVSVAGTNGKGSVSTMLESIFRNAGYVTGLYTSPHLVHFNERFVVSGTTISDEELIEEFELVESLRGEVPLTFFEYGTAIAVDYFVRKKVDVAIMEVGLGGRKDAVNVLDADLACITSIGTDHKRWLGDTREKVGYEKAGIFRTGQLAVCTDSQIPNSVYISAEEVSLNLHANGKDFQLDTKNSEWTWRMKSDDISTKIEGITPPAIAGYCQRENTAGAIAVAVLARKLLNVPDEAIRHGLSTASLEGRLQVVQHSPQVLLDVAHNIESVRELKKYLIDNPVKGKNIALMSSLSEKPIELMVDCVESLFDDWHLCCIHDERGITARKLYRRVHPYLGETAKVELHYDVSTAFDIAIEQAAPEDRIVVFGSFLTVGDIIQRYRDNGP